MIYVNYSFRCAAIASHFVNQYGWLYASDAVAPVRGIMQIGPGAVKAKCMLHEFCKFEGSANGNATRINKWAVGAPETHTAENKKRQGRSHFKWH